MSKIWFHPKCILPKFSVFLFFYSVLGNTATILEEHMIQYSDILLKKNEIFCTILKQVLVRNLSLLVLIFERSETIQNINGIVFISQILSLRGIQQTFVKKKLIVETIKQSIRTDLS